MGLSIKYREGFKYQLDEPVRVRVPEFAGYSFEHDYFSLRDDGTLNIYRGYAWDGLTGALDDNKSLPAALVHDVACQAVQEGLVEFKFRHPLGDAVFRRLMVENGVWKWVAWYRWRAVCRYAKITGGDEAKKVLTAP